MNLTKSVRELATGIDAAPNYDSNDDVSENEKNCVKLIALAILLYSLLLSPHVDGVLSSIALRLHLQSSG